jgi:hypothetical protein
VRQALTERKRRTRAKVESRIPLEDRAKACVEAQLRPIVVDPRIPNANGRRQQVVDLLEAVTQVVQPAEEGQLVRQPIVDPNVGRRPIDVQHIVFLALDEKAGALENEPLLRVAGQLVRDVVGRRVGVPLGHRQAGAERASPHLDGFFPVVRLFNRRRWILRGRVRRDH